MTTALATLVDSVSTAFDVIPSDCSETHVRHLPPDIPALLKTLSNNPCDWLRGATSPPTHFLYLDAIGYICVATGKRVSLWRDSGSSNPIEYREQETITCIGKASHDRVEHSIIICADKKMRIINVQHSLRGSVHFVPVPLNNNDLPTEITALQTLRPGKVLMGGVNGVLYDLRIELDTVYPDDGYRVTVSPLTWDLKKLLVGQFPIRQIFVDAERELAYAVNEAGELEVLSFAKSLLSDRPIRVATLGNAQDLHMVSFAVLPTTGFGEAVLLGVTLCGKLCYFALDHGCYARKGFSAEEMSKRAKTWCGIGLKKNLRRVSVNEAPSHLLAETINEGAVVRIAAVLQTTIYLSVHNYGSGQSTLWEMKNGMGNAQDLQMIPSFSIRGSILGIRPTEQFPRLFPGDASSEQRFRTHELTMQHFYKGPKMTVFSSEQYMEVERQWPVKLLEDILNGRQADAMAPFVQTYGAAETCAMIIRLCIDGKNIHEKAMLKNRVMVEVLSRGFVTCLRRITAPIWMCEIFAVENWGSFVAPDRVMTVQLSEAVLKLLKEATKKFLSYLRGFLIRCQVDVYEGDAVFVHSTSGITHEQAKDLVAFRSFLECFHQSMGFLALLHKMRGFSITKSKIPDLSREISMMSVRDFLHFALRRRTELSRFFDELRSQLSPDDAHELDRFFKKNAPLLDPAPIQSKEDSLDRKLSSDLKALRREIRSLNEQLGKFQEIEIKDPRLSSIQLREHYQPVMAKLQQLVDKIFYADNRAAVVREALQFAKVTLEVEHPEMRRYIMTEIALSPLGDKRILSCEPAFEGPLRVESGIEQGYRPFSHLKPRQIKAIERLVGFYEAISRFSDAGYLSVMLATRQHNVNLSGPTLDDRLTCLKVAQKFFDLAGKRRNIQSIVHQIRVQKEMLSIVADRYADYEKDVEDEQILTLLNVSILSKSELREMVLCWLEDDNAETRAAFKKSKEFNNLEGLLEAIA